MILRALQTSLMLAALVAASMAWSQAPFALDPSFQTSINSQYISSVVPLADGKLLISGQIKFPGDLYYRSSSRLNADGSKDPDYPDVTYAGGKFTPWNGRFYVGNGSVVRRMWSDGTLDSDFILLTTGPYFSPLQGGDYHVYPDGRILMSGAHHLTDSVRGFEGLYNLIWFSDAGYLDTTRTHRTGNGVLYEFEQLPSGGFICSGAATQFDGQATGGTIFRVDSTGAIDTTFQTGVFWGEAYGFLPLTDGRCYAAGLFRIVGIPDTLQLVRFMPDGSLDPTFNNTIDFRIIDITTYPFGALLRSVQTLGEDRLIITGTFEEVEGIARRGICLVDTSGALSNDQFNGAGCGNFVYMGETSSAIAGITQAPDGSWYIYGAYHGYDDGTANYPGQRMVSRLYGLDVGVSRLSGTHAPMQVWPIPASVSVQVEILRSLDADELQVWDALGRSVIKVPVTSNPTTLELMGLSPGMYMVSAMHSGVRLGTVSLVVEGTVR